jgi:DNA-binding transcriptional MocR family regulator
VTLVEKVKLVVHLSADCRLSAWQRLVGIVLLMHFHNTQTGACFPSIPMLAEMSGVSQDTARRAVHSLKSFGYLHFNKNNGGRNRRNEYTFKTLAGAPGFNDDDSNKPSHASDKTLAVQPEKPSHPSEGHISKNRTQERTHERCEASPSPLNEASASLKEGLQEKQETEAERKERHNREWWAKRGKKPPSLKLHQ